MTSTPGTEPDTAQEWGVRRAPLDHPSRKVRYALQTDIRPWLGALTLSLQALITELRVSATDPATWDELVALRRYVREAEAQMVHLNAANDEWAFKAAADVH